MMDKQTVQRIDSFREGLGTKLEELQRKAVAATDAIVPESWRESTWIRVGAGFAAGYFIGSRTRRSANHETILHAIVRAALAAAAAMIVKQILDTQRTA